METNQKCCGKCGGEIGDECYCGHTTTCICHPQEEKEWEKELLEITRKSWGAIMTQSKQELMLADYERRKAFVIREKHLSYQAGRESMHQEYETELTAREKLGYQAGLKFAVEKVAEIHGMLSQKPRFPGGALERKYAFQMEILEGVSQSLTSELDKEVN